MIGYTFIPTRHPKHCRHILMWFSLPLEVRLDVYRRSRFLTARERVAKKVAAQSARPILLRRCIRWAVYIVSFHIKDDKFMNIEYLIEHPRFEEGRDILIVDICDYSRIAIFLRVNDNGMITLAIGTEYSVRSVRRRPYDQDLLNSSCTTYVQWFRDRRCPS
jgi:hypothetical protein